MAVSEAQVAAIEKTQQEMIRRYIMAHREGRISATGHEIPRQFAAGTAAALAAREARSAQALAKAG
jgi:hypothetical protein